MCHIIEARLYLGVVYIMENEVIPCSFNTCDWLLNSSRGHFGLHQEKKMWEWPWNLRSPKGLISSLHYLLAWSNAFSRFICQGTMAKRCHFNICNYVFWGSNVAIITRKEGKKKGRRSNMKKNLKTTFLDIPSKISTSAFGCMVNSLAPH